jgi:polyisoprenoid-binding protein YceI
MKANMLAAALWAVAIPVTDAELLPPAPTRDTPIRAESRLWITGASNLRRFTCRAGELTGSVDLRANATRRAVLSGQNVSDAASLRVPLSRLECGTAAMDRHLRDALNASEHPSVEFLLDAYDVRLATASPTARIAGRLRVAGAERPVLITAAVADDASGALHLRGAVTLLMTDFGVTPPRRFAGLLRVRDQVAVHFDIVPDRDDDTIDGAPIASIGTTAPHNTTGEAHVTPN